MKTEKEIIEELIDEYYELFKGGVNIKLVINQIYQKAKEDILKNFVEELKKRSVGITQANHFIRLIDKLAEKFKIGEEISK